MAERKISVTLEGRMDSLSRTLQQAESDTERHTREMRSSFDRVDAGIMSVGRSLGNLAGGLVGGFALSQIDTESVKAAFAAEKLNLQFKASTGDAAMAGQELDYVRRLSDDLGLSFNQTATAYGKFLASTRNTSIEGEPARRVFEGVSKAVTAMGLSAEESDGIFLALSQMMSKGKVSAEELTGQLGERLPGALKLAADAMGLTTGELMKQMQEGKVMSSDLLPKLGAELERTYGKAAEEAATKGQAAINRFKNEVELTEVAIGDKLLPALGKLANWGADGLKTVRENPQGPLDHVFRLIAWAETGKLITDPTPPLPDYDPQMSRVQADQRARKEEANQKSKQNELGGANSRARGGGNGKGGVDGGSGMNSHVEDYYRNREELHNIDSQMYQDAQGQNRHYLNEVLNKMSAEQQKLFDQSSMQSSWAVRNSASDREANAFGARYGFTGESPEISRINQEMEAMEQAWAMQTDSYQIYEQRMAQIAQWGAEQREKINDDEQKQKHQAWNNYTSAAMNLTNALFTFSSGKSKTLFEINKVAGIANATVSTYTGAANALKDVPYPYNIAAAASIVASGLAQVAQISSTSFGGGGGAAAAGGFGGGTPTSPVVTQPQYNSQQQPSITVHVKMENVYGNSDQLARWAEEQLAPIMRDATTRNIIFIPE